MNNTGYILWTSIVQYCRINWTRLSCELSRIILWTNKNASYELQNLSHYELSRIDQWSVHDTSLELLSIILLTIKEITFKHCNFGLFLKSTEMDVTLTVLVQTRFSTPTLSVPVDTVNVTEGGSTVIKCKGQVIHVAPLYLLKLVE